MRYFFLLMIISQTAEISKSVVSLSLPFYTIVTFWQFFFLFLIFLISMMNTRSGVKRENLALMMA